MLELRAVTTSAGREAVLNRASFSFPTGVVTSVLGLSSAGQTRLARVLSGADAVREGHILLSGSPLGRTRKRVIMAGAFPGSVGERRPRDLLSRALRDGGAPRGAMRSEIERLAISIGLGGRLDGRVRDLSPDEMGRLMLVSVFAARPTVAVFDKAVGQLGVDAREKLFGDLVRMTHETGATTVWLSDVVGDAKVIGEHTLVLDGGRFSVLGPTEEVFGNPGTLAVACATAQPALNQIRLAAKDGVLRLADGSRFEAPAGLKLPGEGMCTLAFRPEHVALGRANEEAVRFVVRVIGEQVTGGRAYVQLGFAGESWLAPKPEAGAPGIGVTLGVFVDRERLMVFDADGMAVH